MSSGLAERIATASVKTDTATLVRFPTSSFPSDATGRQAHDASSAAQALRYATAFENISQGVCFFDGEHRLILSNRRYAEIYRLAPEQTLPGVTLRDVAEARVAAGTCATSADDYLKLCAEINSGIDPSTWAAVLADGRTIRVCHQPMPDGGWVATHEDITELRRGRRLADERISMQALIDWVPDYLWVKDRESRFVVANKALAFDGGRAKTSDMIGLSDKDMHDPEAAQAFRAREEAILASGQPMVDEEEFVIDGRGDEKWVSSTKVPLRNDRNEIIGLVGISRDITARRRADALRDGQAQILEMIARQAPLNQVLDHLVRLVESQIAGTFGAILLTGRDGVRMHHVASPSLAEGFAKAVDGIAPGRETEAFGAAIFRREAVFVKDIADEPLWEDYRELAVAHGYRSSWTNPICARRGRVLGLLALYSPTPREPTEADASLMAMASHIASIAIELS